MKKCVCLLSVVAIAFSVGGWQRIQPAQLQVVVSHGQGCLVKSTLFFSVVSQKPLNFDVAGAEIPHEA